MNNNSPLFLVFFVFFSLHCTMGFATKKKTLFSLWIVQFRIHHGKKRKHYRFNAQTNRFGFIQRVCVANLFLFHFWFFFFENFSFASSSCCSLLRMICIRVHLIIIIWFFSLSLLFLHVDQSFLSLVNRLRNSKCVEMCMCTAFPNENVSTGCFSEAHVLIAEPIDAGECVSLPQADKHLCSLAEEPNFEFFFPLLLWKRNFSSKRALLQQFIRSSLARHFIWSHRRTSRYFSQWDTHDSVVAINRKLMTRFKIAVFQRATDTFRTPCTSQIRNHICDSAHHRDKCLLVKIN